MSEETKTTSNDNNLPSIIPQLSTLAVDSSKYWVSVPFNALKGYVQELQVRQLAKLFGIVSDEELEELEPYLLKTKDGIVLSVYGPRLGLNEDGEFSLQIGNQIFPMTKEVFDHFEILINEGKPNYLKVLFFPGDEITKTPMVLGCYTEEPVTEEHLRTVKTMEGLTKFLSPLKSAGVKALNPVDFQEQVLTINSLTVRTIQGKDGTFKSVTGEVIIDGKPVTMVMKGKAKAHALSILGNEGTLELPSGTKLHIGKGIERTFNGHAYTQVPMNLAICNNGLLSQCKF